MNPHKPPREALTRGESVKAATIFRTETIRRFLAQSQGRFKDGAKTPYLYGHAWGKFVGFAGLGKNPSATLKRKGQDLLREFIAVTKPYRWEIAGVKAVWECNPFGPFPIRIRDFSKSIKQPGKRECPMDSDIEPFFKAGESESDPYAKSLILALMAYGWRPGNQIAKLKWHNLRFDPNGKPTAIIADGAKEGFKTKSFIKAFIPPMVSEALDGWRKESPDTSPEAPIWPRRAYFPGRIRNPKRAHDKDSMADFLKAFKQTHQIRSGLTAVHFRHWVKYQGRKRHMDLALLAYWQGHDTKSEMGGMSGVYGTNLPEPAIFEGQSDAWPDGPLDAFAPRLRIVDELAPYQVAIADYNAGRIGAFEMAQRMEQIREKARSKQALIPP